MSGLREYLVQKREALLARPEEAGDEQLRSSWGVFVVSAAVVAVGC